MRGAQTDRSPRLSAIALGASIALAAELIAAVFAFRRTRQELRASAERQQAALAAEFERLRATLRSEDERVRRNGEHAVLDTGAALVVRFRRAVAESTVDSRGKPILTDAWRNAASELMLFSARLTLWFDERSPVVSAFADLARLADSGTTWSAELRGGERRITPSRSGATQATAERTLEDVQAGAQRYLNAAREHLQRS